MLTMLITDASWLPAHSHLPSGEIRGLSRWNGDGSFSGLWMPPIGTTARTFRVAVSTKVTVLSRALAVIT